MEWNILEVIIYTDMKVFLYSSLLTLLALMAISTLPPC